MPQGDVIRAAVANGIGGELPQERASLPRHPHTSAGVSAGVDRDGGTGLEPWIAMLGTHGQSGRGEVVPDSKGKATAVVESVRVSAAVQSIA
jgi:hypothetical protein